MTIPNETAIDRLGPPAMPPASPESVRTTYRRLRMGGLSAAEAGNLTAHLSGIHATPQGWAIEEVEHLLFVRAMVDRGRIGS